MDVRTQTKYDDLVDIRLPILSLTKFIHARDVQLNEHCVSVFFEKTALLNDTDFVQMDCCILETIGYKNNWIRAIKCLRKMVGFKEGTDMHDKCTDYVIKKHVGQNRYDIHVRKCMLEHFVVIANTCNSRTIHEYFRNVRQVLMEYRFYCTLYRTKTAPFSLFEYKLF